MARLPNKAEKTHPRRVASSESQVILTLHPEEEKVLAQWIAAQPAPQPTQGQAMRRLIRIAFEASGFQVPAITDPESLDERIERAEKSLSTPKAAGPPSPAKGMQMLRRGMAENKLRGLKNRKIRSERSS